MDTQNDTQESEHAHDRVDLNPWHQGRDEYKKALGDRIRLCRAQMSRSDMAIEIDVHANTLAKFERGETMPDAFELWRIATLGGRTVQWLITGEEDMGAAAVVPRAVTAIEIGNYVYVPHFDVQAAAGNGYFNDVQSVKAMRPFEASFIRGTLGIGHDRLALIEVVGNSMEPEFRSRDSALVDLQACDVVTEGVHAIRIDGALMVKRVQRLPGRTLRVSSTNAAYDPFEIQGSEEMDRDFEIVGRVRWGGITFN